jgi:prevent-host-death family protein
MKTRVIGATEFKAKCLALLDEVNEQGNTITVTKRGRPVATISPARKQKWKSPMGILTGKVKILGDIVNAHISDHWDMLERDEDSSD